MTTQPDLTVDQQLDNCKLNHLSIRGNTGETIGGPSLRPSASFSTLSQYQTGQLSPAALRRLSFSNSINNPSQFSHFKTAAIAAPATASLRPLRLLSSSKSTDLPPSTSASLQFASSDSLAGSSTCSTQNFQISGSTLPPSHFQFEGSGLAPTTVSDLQFGSNVSIDSAASTSHTSTPAPETSSGATTNTTQCVVCGDVGASKHYGVMACLGCKGFFRRALKKADEYECINNDRCVIDQHGRNSCRSCRFKKCLDSGMNPAAVRPDRDFTGKQQIFRLPANPKRSKTSTPASSSTNAQHSTTAPNKQNDPNSNKSTHVVDKEEIWKKLPVDVRTTIMNLLNVEVKICRGDTANDASNIYPLYISNIRDVIENPAKLRGKRTEMRYEPYRMAKNEELHTLVYRRLIAAIDWVECLAEMMGGLEIDDKIVLVKSCFGPLMLFKNAARTASVTNDENILCVCNFSYVPRNMANAYSDTYHLDNGLVAQVLDGLVSPMRKIQLSETELVCLCAIIVLNPMARDLSEQASGKVSELRDKIQEALFQYVKELQPDQTPTIRFGNLLLYLPILTSLANMLRENIRFAQTFSTLGGIPLLTSLFGCFPVEPFLDSENRTTGTVLRKSVEVQTDGEGRAQPRKKVTKRRLPQSFTSPVENEQSSAWEFRLLQPPNTYTLTEMFDDRMNNSNSFLQVHNNSRRVSPRGQPAQSPLPVPQFFQQTPSTSQQQQPQSSSMFMDSTDKYPTTTNNNNIILSSGFNQPQPQKQQKNPPTIFPFTNQQFVQQPLTLPPSSSNNHYHTISGYPTTSVSNFALVNPAPPNASTIPNLQQQQQQRFASYPLNRDPKGQ